MEYLDLEGEFFIKKFNGFTITRKGIEYKISNFPEVAYLDLMDNELKSKDVDDWDIRNPGKCIEYILQKKSERQDYVNLSIYVQFEKYYSKIMKAFPEEIIAKYLKVFAILQICNHEIKSMHVYTRLIRLLIKRKICEPSLIVKILTTVCATSSILRYVFCVTGSSRRLNFLLGQAQAAHFSLWGLIHDTPMQYENQNFCPILSAVMWRNCNHLEILLKNGVVKQNFKFIHLPLHDLLVLNGTDKDEFSLYAAFDANSENGLIRLDSRFSTRDHLIFEWTYIICMAIYQGDCHVTQITKKMSLLYRTLRDPFVSAEEMRQRLRSIAPLADPEAVESIVTNYMKLFTEATLFTEPRSLKHLCRCTIRSSLRNSFQMRYGIDSIKPLPPKIARYLRLKY